MAPLKIGYVPEHFSSPLLQLAAEDKSIEIVEQASGTGQMITSLGDGTIDVAIALTEGLIAGLAKGNETYKLVGSYVRTPLNWAIITGSKAPHQSVSDLRGKPIGISRIGSGSQIMAYVLALREKWFKSGEEVEDLTFDYPNSFTELRNDVNDGTTAFFMWEWFTTKPFQDSGEVRFIGNIETPWPIAASTKADPAAVASFVANLSKFTQTFDSDASRAGPAIDYIVSTHGYPREDIAAWLKTVAWEHDCAVIKSDVILHVLDVLATAGAVTKPSDGWKIDSFVNSDIAKLEETADVRDR